MKISPSILASDFGRLREEFAAMEKAGADMIHLDIMDGHFVPNISFGPPLIASMRGQSGLFFDVHLMISDPLRYIDAFAKAGADLIMFHIECDSDVEETIAAIRAHGLKAGVSLKPKTPVEDILPYLPLVDMVLVMTVEPGFGGQSFMADQMDKLAAIRDRAKELGLDGLLLQVDGGIDNTTAPIVAANGANCLVAGSALFGKPDYKAALESLRAAALSGVS